MLSDLIARAAAGEPLWMPELREAFSKFPDASPMMLRLRLVDGRTEDRSLSIPRWNSPEEKRFVLEYLWASVYNLLSVCSGSSMTFYFDLQNAQLQEAFQTLDDVFQLDRGNRSGYGKVISIANRLCSAFGQPPFSFRRAAWEEYAPLPEAAPTAENLSPERQFRRRREAAEQMTLCGIDIGGTDIKLALSVNGRLICTGEFDWNPAASRSAEEILNPILGQVELLRRRAAARLGLSAPPLLDAVGISFPDIVIDNRILGGETPKTAGLRASHPNDYDQEFAKLGDLTLLLLPQCRPGAAIRIVNDGNAAAFTTAMELSSGPDAALIRSGLFAHTLGTDLGTGWLWPDGSVPSIPLEMYDLILDLGSRPAAAYSPRDLRSVRNENSGLPAARRYLGQSAAFRLAWELSPDLLDGFTVRDGGCLVVRTEPEDLRKPCLEHLMQLASAGRDEAKTVFRRIGQHLGIVSREADYLLGPRPERCFLYGRFVKSAACFSLLSEGCRSIAPRLRLIAADETLALTPLMKQLAAFPDITVAQFGQAVGALYYAIPD